MSDDEKEPEFLHVLWDDVAAGLIDNRNGQLLAWQMESWNPFLTYFRPVEVTTEEVAAATGQNPQDVNDFGKVAKFVWEREKRRK